MAALLFVDLALSGIGGWRTLRIAAAPRRAQAVRPYERVAATGLG